MKTLLDVILILAWVVVYLAVVYGVGRYRRARAVALGIAGPHEYRADKDAGLWLAVFVAGTLLCAVAFFVTGAGGPVP
jgi:uncharacterized membrane protein